MADAKQGKASVEDFCNGSAQSRVVLAKPRLGGFGMSNYATSSNKTSNPFVLRPPQLKTTTSNPFAKAPEPSESVREIEKDASASTTENRLKESTDEDTPKFVPLGSANVTPRTTNSVPATAQPPTSTPSSGFVFGQNLSERVFMKEKMNNGDSNEHSSSNGASELLFTNAAVSATEGNQEPNAPEPSSSGEGLAAAAAEYERSHARPVPFTTNVTTTGEEDEVNVLQISCRIFAWESGSWRERGRGVLRLNDVEDGGAARLVARVAGSLRVVLNTKLWPDMVVEKAGTKSLRITASDAQQQVKLFLIMAAPSDIVHLYRALVSRIASSKKIVTSSQKSTSQQAAERLEAAADDDEFSDSKEQPDGNINDLSDPSGSTDDKDCTSNRLNNPQIKIDESTDDYINEDAEAKALKRKEPTDADVSPKRQCPEV